MTEKIFLYVVVVLSATFHEYGHALIAHHLGDDTAKQEGRLTLNPLAHLDPLGTVFIPLLFLLSSGIFIGWAKPVPYNPYKLRDKKYGSLKVSLAGPGANFLIAIALGIILRIFYYKPLWFSFLSAPFSEFLPFIIYINIFLALFNLLPIPPFDGSRIFIDLFPRYSLRFLSYGFWGIFVALLLGFFLIPPFARLFFWIITGKNLFF